MAQKRMLDKKISISEQVANLPVEAALIFTWSIPHADDLGLLPISLRTLKAMIIPMLEMSLETFGNHIGGICEQGLYTVWEHEGDKFYRITKFAQNQTLKKDRKPYTLAKNVDDWDTVESLGFHLETFGNPSKEKRREEKLSKEKRREVKIPATALDLKTKFQTNPIWESLVKQYPDRDYEFEFELMCNWWVENKKHLPKQISAFNNWLRNSKPDEKLLNKRIKTNEIQSQKVMIEKALNTPKATEEQLEKLRLKAASIGKKI